MKNVLRIALLLASFSTTVCVAQNEPAAATCPAVFAEFQVPTCPSGSPSNGPCQTCVAEIRRQIEGNIANLRTHRTTCEARLAACTRRPTQGEEALSQTQALEAASGNYQRDAACFDAASRVSITAAEQASDCGQKIERACAGTTIAREGSRIAGLCTNYGLASATSAQTFRSRSRELTGAASNANENVEQMRPAQSDLLGTLSKLAPLAVPLAALAQAMNKQDDAKAAPLPTASSTAAQAATTSTTPETKSSPLDKALSSGAKSGDTPISAHFPAAASKEGAQTAAGSWQGSSPEISSRPLESQRGIANAPASSAARSTGEGNAGSSGSGSSENAPLPLASQAQSSASSYGAAGELNMAGGHPIGSGATTSPAIGDPVIDANALAAFNQDLNGNDPEISSGIQETRSSTGAVEYDSLFHRIHSRYAKILRERPF